MSEQCREERGRVQGQQGEATQKQGKEAAGAGRVWVNEGGNRRLDPVLALTLTHCVTLGKAFPLPRPRSLVC